MTAGQEFMFWNVHRSTVSDSMHAVFFIFFVCFSGWLSGWLYVNLLLLSRFPRLGESFGSCGMILLDTVEVEGTCFGVHASRTTRDPLLLFAVFGWGSVWGYEPEWVLANRSEADWLSASHLTCSAWGFPSDEVWGWWFYCLRGRGVESGGGLMMLLIRPIDTVHTHSKVWVKIITLWLDKTT